MDPELPAPDARLVRLESELGRARRVAWAALGVAMLALAVLGAMQIRATREFRSDRLVTKRLDVVDRDGRLAVIVGSENDHGGRFPHLEMGAVDRPPGDRGARIGMAAAGDSFLQLNLFPGRKLPATWIRAGEIHLLSHTQSEVWLSSSDRDGALVRHWFGPRFSGVYTTADSITHR